MKVMVNAREFKNHLSAALLAVAGPNDARTALQCIRVEFDGERHRARLIATSGHWLFASELACDVGQQARGFTLIDQAAATVMKNTRIIPGVSLSTLDIHARVFAHAAFSNPWLDNSHLTFSRYHHVLPSVAGKETRTVSADPRYLDDICKAFALVGGRTKREPPLAMTMQASGGALDPILFSVHGITATAVLMQQKQYDTNDPWRMMDHFRKPLV